MAQHLYPWVQNIITFFYWKWKQQDWSNHNKSLNEITNSIRRNRNFSKELHIRVIWSCHLGICTLHLWVMCLSFSAAWQTLAPDWRKSHTPPHICLGYKSRRPERKNNVTYPLVGTLQEDQGRNLHHSHICKNLEHCCTADHTLQPLDTRQCLCISVKLTESERRQYSREPRVLTLTFTCHTIFSKFVASPTVALWSLWGLLTKVMATFLLWTAKGCWKRKKKHPAHLVVHTCIKTIK